MMSYKDAVLHLWKSNWTEDLEELAYQLIVAIKQLHQRDIRHSDIQPNNIVVYVNDRVDDDHWSAKSASEVVKIWTDQLPSRRRVKLFLVDFGSSSNRNRATSSGITDFFSSKDLLDKSWKLYVKNSYTFTSVDLVSVGYLLFMTFTGKNLMQLIYEQIIDPDPWFDSDEYFIWRAKVVKWVADSSRV